MRGVERLVEAAVYLAIRLVGATNNRLRLNRLLAISCVRWSPALLRLRHVIGRTSSADSATTRLLRCLWHSGLLLSSTTSSWDVWTSKHVLLLRRSYQARHLTCVRSEVIRLLGVHCHCKLLVALADAILALSGIIRLGKLPMKGTITNIFYSLTTFTWNTWHIAVVALHRKGCLLVVILEVHVGRGQIVSVCCGHMTATCNSSCFWDLLLEASACWLLLLVHPLH